MFCIRGPIRYEASLQGVRAALRLKRGFSLIVGQRHSWTPRSRGVAVDAETSVRGPNEPKLAADARAKRSSPAGG
jgi:hypothetical protein